MEVRDKKGCENVVVGYLSRIPTYQIPTKEEVQGSFPDEQLFATSRLPWFAHIVNYLDVKKLPHDWTTQQKRYFFSQLKYYYWEDQDLFKYFPDQIVQKCVPDIDHEDILKNCHSYACGGHFSGKKTRIKGNLYILLVVDYISMWVEAIATKTNDHRVVCKFVKNHIFTRHGYPRVIISDGGTHFCNMKFSALEKHYGITHRIATPYHPQTSGQVEVSNREIKHIMEKTMRLDRKDWSSRLEDAL
ncbi:hypothetical protein L6452_15123 [Arctium lappa]|uniref:Uncharacterized protein n=1 Tax=Arctium lappa TaxID=4217 RepID=A0ACB9CMX2_ARCLA|nr:hypothetical protein L6452_15123 [Arctium lappa]